ncbi:hypothetical protein M2347_000637 [Chryseobacterium sp. H1D6B]|uniref:hypothetical protein n=1 Tax=Chryseobacterium sp. H1D6B TaxID=2940588 RepID=UPI0015CE0261|nr:hypothetical protein [Chryseobacterium sp. H1D6B]MDH6250910.1 hypothetical protein [Chryseobacterium sp. H1D6B]
MKTREQKNSNERKLNNTSFDVLREIKLIKEGSLEFGLGIIKFTSVLNNSDWGFKDDNKYPYFHSLGLSMCNYNKAGSIGKYQAFCLIKLSSILYDARLLYENNLIDFTELYSIVARVKNDAYKRFKSIEKSHAKKELKNKHLDSDSLVLLQAKLAILENEN